MESQRSVYLCVFYVRNAPDQCLDWKRACGGWVNMTHRPLPRVSMDLNEILLAVTMSEYVAIIVMHGLASDSGGDLHDHRRFPAHTYLDPFSDP